MRIEEKIKKYLNEGTWEVPNTVAKVKKIEKAFENFLSLEDAKDKLWGVLGDDELWDSMETIGKGKRGAKLDMRVWISRWIYNHWLSKIRRPSDWDPKAWEMLEELVNKYRD